MDLPGIGPITFENKNDQANFFALVKEGAMSPFGMTWEEGLFSLALLFWYENKQRMKPDKRFYPRLLRPFVFAIAESPFPRQLPGGVELAIPGFFCVQRHGPRKFSDPILRDFGLPPTVD